MIFVVEQVGGRYKAFPKDQPSEFAYGSTKQEALGNMLSSWHDELGVEIEDEGATHSIKKQVIPQGF